MTRTPREGPSVGTESTLACCAVLRSPSVAAFDDREVPELLGRAAAVGGADGEGAVGDGSAGAAAAAATGAASAAEGGDATPFGASGVTPTTTTSLGHVVPVRDRPTVQIPESRPVVNGPERARRASSAP